MAVSGASLVLDAAAGNGTIAVLRDGVLVAEANVVMRSAREERFFPAVLETLARAGVALPELQRLIVGAGPGSFTALRVVGAVAKGIAQGRGIAMYALPSLALVRPPESSAASGSRWLVTLDALRAQRYAALVVRDLRNDLRNDVRSVEPLGVIATSELPARATQLGAILIGPDEAISAQPEARHAIDCLALIDAAGPVDLASWEPVYGRLAEAQVQWEAAQGRPLA